jgi:hypothetical protein
MKHRSAITALVVGVFLWVGSSSAFAVTFKNNGLEWQTSSLAEAAALAKQEGKKILLVRGNYPSCATTSWMLETAAESSNPPIKNWIQQSYIPWYEGTDGSDGYVYWRGSPPGEQYELPLVCIVDPDDVTPAKAGTYLYRAHGPNPPYAVELQALNAALQQYASCGVNTLSPLANVFEAPSGTGTITVTPFSSGCTWTASSNNSWITITAGSPHTGPGTVSYSVAANTGLYREGTITIGGKTFTVTQNGSTTCAKTISPLSSPLFSPSPARTPFGVTGNTGTVSVSSTCSWSAISNVPWITITAGNTGNGNGTVSYSVAANTGGARTGIITIGGQTFTVSQDGTIACTFAIAPSVYPSFNASSNTGSIHVTPSAAGCSWTAGASVPWITINSGSGTGTGDVTFTVAANAGAQRTGAITIADKTSTITQAPATMPLYFPHVDTSLPWQTEIALINTSAQPVTGILRALNNDGASLEIRTVALPARGRVQIDVASEFAEPTDIGYIMFESSSDAVQGYSKLYQDGIYRAATPAVREPNTSDIYLSHIASDAEWWTGICLLNTTSAAKELTITFNNGQSRNIQLAAKEHQVFTIAGWFDNQPQPDIRSAVITNAGGLIGMEVFGSTVGGKTLMDGILLTGNTASTIYYPHVAGDGWWTGIVAYNPSGSAANITITPYSAPGTPLASSTLSLPGKGKYVGTPATLGLPAETAWFKIESTLPLSGFELFGTTDNRQLAAYSAGTGTGAKAGVFAKIEKLGWTGITFVNTEDGAATVTLTAYSNNGNSVAVSTLAVGGHAKEARLAEALFAHDISSATYIAYTSDRNVVGLQLNASSDGMMLDGLPALAGAN